MPTVVEEALEKARQGGMVVVVDDEGRENEGDLVLAADAVTPEKLAFMVRHTSGFICVAVTEERADELDLPLMVQHNTEAYRTAFTVTVDAVAGTTTGISARDRATTVRAIVDPATKPEDLARPGHVHVLRACRGGVLERPGHTEAAVDLARLAGRYPAGVIAEVVTSDGLGMAKGEELRAFANEHGLPLLSIAELAHYRRCNEKLVREVAKARVPTAFGTFTCYAFEEVVSSRTHLALVAGDLGGGGDVLARVHSECFTGDVLGSLRCDCGEQLAEAMKRVAEAGRGVIVYLRGHEGRGVGIVHKLQAYQLQDNGFDTVDANIELGLPVDSRDYWAGAQVLLALGAKKVRLMTNNPRKCEALRGFGVEVSQRVPLEARPNGENITYLRAKRTRLGHRLSYVGPALGGPDVC